MAAPFRDMYQPPSKGSNQRCWSRIRVQGRVTPLNLRRSGALSASNGNGTSQKEHQMAGVSGIREHMEVIGADGVPIGTVDKVEGGRIKLTRKDSGEGSHKGHHHYIDRGLVAGVEGNKVRLSAIGAIAVTMEQEK